LAEWIQLQDEESVARILPEGYAKRIRNGDTDTFESRAEGILLSFSHYDVRSPQEKPGQIIVWITREKVCFLFGRQSDMDMAMQAEPGVSDHEMLCRFFQNMIQGDMRVQEALEARIIRAEDDVMRSTTPSVMEKITDFRRSLFAMKKYYEQLGSILEGLTQNENGFVPREDQMEFQILSRRVQRLYENVHSLRDYVTQVREAYQSQIGIRQNHLMKTFTVVTAIFSPLSLLVGWYGMNLQMPEFAWKYGYLFVIGLAILIISVCYGIFKKHGWLK